ncbi:MAG: hypothetical protein H7323_14315 [Frankiales bacterium]|nr:hypothetical protein [Frankiales bacterium]
MGAQAAALLDAGGPVGELPPAWEPGATVRLQAPAAYDLDRVARGHAGVGHAPSAYDGTRLHRVLPGGVRAAVNPDLRVDLSGPADVIALLRDVLCLDDDLTSLHEACDRVPSLAWVRGAGAGRVLRAPTAFEDLAGVLASTNTSYAATRRMLAGIVRVAFPTPDEVLTLGEADARAAGWGYRAPALLALAARAGEIEHWRTPEVDDDEVLAGLESLPGFGAYAAATALPLLGHRPRPLVLDGWLRRQVADPSVYAPMGRWAGTGLWLAVTAHRGGNGPRGR